MIAWACVCFLVVGFLLFMRKFALVEKSRKILNLSHRSFEIIRSSSLSDEEKETSLQKKAKDLWVLFFRLVLGIAGALLIPLGFLWVFDLFGLISLAEVLALTITPAFIIASSVLIVVAVILAKKSDTDSSSYSVLDRMQHRLAFKTYGFQCALADIEDRIFAKELAGQDDQRPVFITALPRAGTTLLLETLVKLPEFASHCYRDMPFVPIPLLWNKFSAPFQQKSRSHERAHGDGMLIDFDSPEALEEVLWKEYWGKQYLEDRIVLWPQKSNTEFTGFFRRHMQKIVYLRKAMRPDAKRYISKNNLNIARTGLLKELFPNAVILVLFRDPLQQAHSLLEQHRNFLRIHADDSFACEYMRALGHHDFGKNLRPVDFGGWLDEGDDGDENTLDFWAKYWVAAYTHLLGDAENVRFVDYDELCREPETVLKGIASAITVNDVDALLSAGGNIHAPRKRDVDSRSISPELQQDLLDVHSRLKNAAV